jgi:hypothetical protein
MYYLYLKKHNVSGLKYLGITKRNPSTYPGSGKHWKAHLKKYGNDVSTEILFETECKDLLAERGLQLSIEWDIVKSREFANLVNEAGYEGRNHGYICPESNKKHLSKLFKGKPLKPEHIEKLRYAKSEEHKKKISDTLKGNTLTNDCKKKISAALKDKPKPTRSEEHSNKIRLALEGSTLTKNHKKNIGEGVNAYHRNRKFQIDGIVYSNRKEANARFGVSFVKRMKREGRANYLT